MMFADRRVQVLSAVTLALVSPVAGALEPVPDTSGWRGFVIAGIGHTDLRSNFVAGNRLIEVGSAFSESITQRAASDSTFHPAFTGEVNYTFDNGWQVFLGQSLEDALTLDPFGQLGVRRNLDGAGTLQAGVLFTGVQTRAWKDPYAEGVPREETDRDMTGARLQWARVMGSAFDVTLTYRDISYDSELSGQGVTSVTCDAICRSLLRRDGDELSLDVSYLFRLGSNQNHLLRPLLRYTSSDREGDAVASDRYWLQLTYAYVRPPFTVTSNIAWGRTNRDAPNPLFGVKTDADRLALDSTVLYRIPAGNGRWVAVGSVQWGAEDADVRFHDSRVLVISVGALYRFGSP